MKKNIIAVILLSASLNNTFLAQSGNDFNKNVDDINKMFPAAPTSNNLMKFEEVPVSYYTGIPDINIPLFNIPTSSPNVSLNVQLKYHPLSAKPDDKAGETGLGWNLLAGGTITRTVRGGVADGKIESTFMSSPPTAKYGIYRHENNPTYKLIFDQLTNWNINEYAFYTGIGKYDTEYDLYQYNFMGNTGRFIIKKDPSGNFIVEKLDRNNLKITSTHDSGGEVQTVTIIDDKGIKYLFKGMESSSKDVSTVKIGLLKNTSNISSNVGGGIYFTAYHLEKVQDQNSNTLLTFNYDQSSQVEYKDTETITTRFPKDIIYNYFDGAAPINPDPQIPGALEVQTVYNTGRTKLLTNITITDKGSINFTYEKGRSDSNYLNSSELYKLKSVQSNINLQSINQFVDKYTFDYDYSNTSLSTLPNPTPSLKKLLLKKITKSGIPSNLNEYNISYNSQTKIFQKDNWGYYKDTVSYQPADITQDVISSITYPTKGKVVFDFGENIYSHFAGFSQPIEPVTGEWVDEDNNFELMGINTFSPTVRGEFFTILSPQTVKLHLDLGSLIYSNWQFNIYKQLSPNVFSAPVTNFGMSWQSCISTSGAQCPGAEIGENGEPVTEYNKEVTLEPGTYYASLSGSHGITQRPISYVLTASTKEHHFNSYLTKRGGGLRINDIKYFESSTSTSPAKEFIYDYRDINDAQKSSGSLVFPEPVFKYTESIAYEYLDENSGSYANYSATSNTTTNFNIIPAEKTQGSDVGYQYVTVKQIQKDTNNAISDNGKTLYKFRSPIDFPNPDVFSLEMPILPITNHDYLRGQMIFEKKYDVDGKILSEINNEHTTLEFTKLEGIKVKDNYYNNIKPNFYKYKYYDGFKMFFPGIILSTPYKYYNIFGVTLPTEKRETSYFYKNGVQSSVVSITNTAYNTEDYPLLVTQISADGVTNVSDYKYAKEKLNQRLITANMLAIPLETETKQNGKTLSKTETKYDNLSNLLPSSVESSDVQNGTSYAEVTYERYDTKGNLQQYRTKEGIPVTIIWGYTQTQPIAKIEGITYDQLANLGIISGIVTASDADAANPAQEGALLTAFTNFKNNSSLNGLKITTYTYDPLIGVTNIIPPTGIRQVYIYDASNRLKEIRESEPTGKILKEFKYNYKN
ncbi:hypothetical protein A0O34_21710 [Chryseobacterium glaciei]|uniref:Sugar-binding protein n=1 Tax=Chryseobacterium glaciei TaxID=1685010 RepID=A0A172Y1F7_9FLAO|nr:hypothetical protein [Chryseobacterium glaciei]ANF52980.1 hypothetical protein A0O34_21710 [Chryseobacterium glaciei]